MERAAEKMRPVEGAKRVEGVERSEGELSERPTGIRLSEAVEKVGVRSSSTPSTLSTISEPSAAIRSTPSTELFEHEILVKTGASEALRRSLDPAKLGNASLVIGTATDAYQPAERKFRITRQILEALTHYRGLSLGLITKSPLVTRDLDLLQQLSQIHEVSVNISLATLDAKLARRLERRSPVPRARLRALKQLTDGGIHAGLLIAPVLPGITDSLPALRALMRAAKDAGACYAVGIPLRLGDSIRQQLFPVLEREFPQLVERYRRHFHRRNHVTPSYQKALMARVRMLQEELDFPTQESRHRRQQLEGQRRRETADPQPCMI